MIQRYNQKVERTESLLFKCEILYEKVFEEYGGANITIKMLYDVLFVSTIVKLDMLRLTQSISVYFQMSLMLQICSRH